MAESSEPRPARSRRRMVARGIAVLGLALAGVVGGRTLWSQPDRRPVAAAPEVPRMDPERTAEHLAAMIRIPTISSEVGVVTSGPAFTALHELVEATYPRTFAAVQTEVLDEHALLLTWAGRDASLDPVVLTAHQDVVPVEPGTERSWRYPPFGGTVAEGYVWGRGAVDCKLAITGILEAVEGLIAAGFRPQRTVIIALGHDEEVGGTRGAAALARRLARSGRRAWVVLDEGGMVLAGVLPGIERPVALVGIAEKGYASVRLTASADGGHSNAPPERTSIGALSSALARLEAAQLSARLSPPTRAMFEALGPHAPWWMRLVLVNLWLFEPAVAWGMTLQPATAATVRTTTALTMFEAGVKDNVLSARAEAIVNFRILPGESVASVLDHVVEVVDDPQITVECVECREPSSVSSPDLEAFEVLQTSIRQVYDDAVVAPYLVVGGTDARYYESMSDQVFRFLPVRAEPSDLQRLHGTDERVSIADLELATTFYATFLVNAAG